MTLLTVLATVPCVKGGRMKCYVTVTPVLVIVRVLSFTARRRLDLCSRASNRWLRTFCYE